jgi:hypothetical protein
MSEQQLEAIRGRVNQVSQKKAALESEQTRLSQRKKLSSLSSSQQARLSRIPDEIFDLDRELGELSLQERRIIDEQEQRDKGHRAELAATEARIVAEERAFWFRRFHTSLAIAHGAAMAAIANKLFDKEVHVAAIKAALAPLSIFAVGMILAGLIPLALFQGRQRTADMLGYGSGLLFGGGVAATIAALIYLAWSQPTAQTTTRATAPAQASSVPMAKHVK